MESCAFIRFAQSISRSTYHRNPGGVRFGSAEIYEVIDSCFADSIEDCIAIGQSIDNGVDERVILFVKLFKDQELSPTLIDAVRTQIRQKRTPRHVPSKVSDEYMLGTALNVASLDLTGTRNPLYSQRKTCRGACKEGKDVRQLNISLYR